MHGSVEMEPAYSLGHLSSKGLEYALSPVSASS